MPEGTTETTSTTGTETTQGSQTETTQQTTQSSQTTQSQTTQQTAEADAKGKGTQAVVPEKYNLKPPEGYTFNPEALVKFQENARTRGLTQEQAQADLDYLFGEIQGMEQRRADAWQKQHESWLSDIKADKELGGKNFDQTVSRARAFAKTLDPTGAFREALDAMGLANHPVLVRGFARLGALMEDDTVDVGGGPSASGFASAKEMFPNSKMN